MTPRIRKLVAGGLAAAALTAAIGGSAFAQATPSPSGTPAPVQRAQEFVNSFASKLGKTPAEVTAAAIAVQKERVAADLAAGRITQAQADAMNQRIDQSGGLGLFGHGAKGGMKGSHRGSSRGFGQRGGPGAPAPAVTPTGA